MVAPAPAGAMAYLVARYPAVSHTFILREVQSLRELGLRVEVASINPPDRSPEQMTPDERAEDQATYGLKRHGVAGALGALGWALTRHPGGVLRIIGEALQFGRGLQRVYALAYAVEAMMVARWMASRQLHHLHVHFGIAGAATVGVLVKSLTGAGLSLTIHGPDEFDDVPGQSLTRKIEGADCVVCISQFGRSQLMRLNQPAHWAKLLLCRLGVDPAAFPYRAPQSHGGPVRLLAVGRLTPAKGQLLLVQACAQLHAQGVPFELTLVGDGPDRPRLEAAARAAGLDGQLHFTGSLNQHQVREQLARADAFVLPSLAEGIPVVLMEAMASGVPCISCPVNGIPELIEHDHTSLLATPGDVDALALQLRRMIEQPELRARLAEAGRAKIERDFDLNHNVRALARIFLGLPSITSTAPKDSPHGAA